MHRLLLAAVLAAAVSAAPAHARTPDARPATLAVIGDVPYGDAQITEFPRDIAEINTDRDVSRVIHLGDIKNGSSRCDDFYFAARLADFQSFDDPLVYTPGDNEWTDCHRTSNGGYLPTDRLHAIRETFFPRFGRTLGRHRDRVAFQSRRYPENVAWSASRVTFATLHVVGSNDDHLPWFGDRTDPATGASLPETRREAALRAREHTARGAAAVDWIDRIFDTAERRGAAAVTIGMQADMWDTAPHHPRR